MLEFRLRRLRRSGIGFAIDATKQNCPIAQFMGFGPAPLQGLRMRGAGNFMIKSRSGWTSDKEVAGCIGSANRRVSARSTSILLRRRGDAPGTEMIPTLAIF